MGIMIRNAAPNFKDPQDLVSYGNYCGKGGSGEALDAVDTCCKHHDACYEAGKQRSSEKTFCTLVGSLWWGRL